MFKAFEKGQNEYNKPFILIDNTKNEKSPTPKGVDDNMKNIYKRKDGRYEYSKMINNERIYIIKSTKQELEKEIRELKQKNKKQKNKYLFKNIIEEWYINFKEPYIKQKAKENYNTTLNKYIIPELGNKSINKITFKDLQLFINNKNDKRRIQEIILQHIKAIFDYAHSNKYINTNPAIALKLPRKTSKESIKPLTIEEQQTLLKSIKGHKLETFIYFSLIFGTRRNETLAFKIEDINEDKQLLHINGTKTENAQRDVKISKDMINYLKANNKTKPYFNFTSDFVTKNITKLLKDLGINKTLHALRHTTATNLFYLGYKDKERQQYLGHANITTTNNIYTYLENDIKKEDIHKLYNNLYFEN